MRTLEDVKIILDEILKRSAAGEHTDPETVARVVRLTIVLMRGLGELHSVMLEAVTLASDLADKHEMSHEVSLMQKSLAASHAHHKKEAHGHAEKDEVIPR